MGFNHSIQMVPLAIFVLLGSSVCFPDLAARADVIWIAGQEKPVFGILVEQDGESIIFEQTLDGKRFERKNIPRQDVVQAVVNFNVPRLESLDPKNLGQYRDFAEELSSQAADPVARNLAIRLFLVAASNADGDADLRKSSLSGLVRLAGSSDELTRWRTLQYLHDEEFSQPLQRQEQKAAPGKTAKAKMLKLVQSLRKGQSIGTIDQDVVKHWGDICRPSEFVEIARANRPSEEQLRKLLQIESQIRNSSLQPGETIEKNWGVLASLPSRPSTLIPSFSNATQFDPAESVYRGGRWVKPLGK